MRTRTERTARAIIPMGSYIMLCRWKHGEWWSVPGGHCKAGEAPEDAVRREIREETGREIATMHYLTTLENPYDKDGVHIEETMALYRATLEPRLVENPAQSAESHLEFAWAPVADLPLWKIMPPAVVPFLQFVGGT